MTQVGVEKSMRTDDGVEANTSVDEPINIAGEMTVSEYSPFQSTHLLLSAHFCWRNWNPFAMLDW
jgi:hypothetical protein